MERLSALKRRDLRGACLRPNIHEDCSMVAEPTMSTTSKCNEILVTPGPQCEAQCHNQSTLHVQPQHVIGLTMLIRRAEDKTNASAFIPEAVFYQAYLEYPCMMEGSLEDGTIP